MNVELLRKIAAVIQEKPAEFDMERWHCGTAHCIGGWAQVLSGIKPDPKAGPKSTCVWGNHAKDLPENLLGLTCEQGDRLFLTCEWPNQFDPDDPSSAAARIEHFIETGGRE